MLFQQNLPRYQSQSDLKMDIWPNPAVTRFEKKIKSGATLQQCNGFGLCVRVLQKADNDAVVRYIGLRSSERHFLSGIVNIT